MILIRLAKFVPTRTCGSGIRTRRLPKRIRERGQGLRRHPRAATRGRQRRGPRQHKNPRRRNHRSDQGHHPIGRRAIRADQRAAPRDAKAVGCPGLAGGRWIRIILNMETSIANQIRVRAVVGSHKPRPRLPTGIPAMSPRTPPPALQKGDYPAARRIHWVVTRRLRRRRLVRRIRTGLPGTQITLRDLMRGRPAQYCSRGKSTNCTDVADG